MPHNIGSMSRCYEQHVLGRSIVENMHQCQHLQPLILLLFHLLLEITPNGSQANKKYFQCLGQFVKLRCFGYGDLVTSTEGCFVVELVSLSGEPSREARMASTLAFTSSSWPISIKLAGLGWPFPLFPPRSASHWRLACLPAAQ